MDSAISVSQRGLLASLHENEKAQLNVLAPFCRRNRKFWFLGLAVPRG